MTGLRAGGEEVKQRDYDACKVPSSQWTCERPKVIWRLKSLRKVLLGSTGVKCGKGRARLQRASGFSELLQDEL